MPREQRESVSRQTWIKKIVSEEKKDNKRERNKTIPIETGMKMREYQD